MMVGDNIYHFDRRTKKWHQADSHHSNADGSVNLKNLTTDTKSDKVLISDHFFYFGREAPLVPRQILNAIGYKNRRNYRVFDLTACADLIAWIDKSFKGSLNRVVADPFEFDQSSKRYAGHGSKIV
jgi:hypothetical protein